MTLVFAIVTPCVTIEPIVIELPIVTEPICAVPATREGRVASETGWVAWKNVPLTGTVPEMLAVTLPICEVPAPIVTEPEIGCV